MGPLFALNSNFGQSDIIDEYSSLIWTERYNDSGEITLVIPVDSESAGMIVTGALLSIEESKDVMLVDTVSIKDEQITAVGKSLTEFLKQRLLRNTWSAVKDHWTINDIPGHIAGTIVSQMCGAGGLMATGAVLLNGANEVLPNLVIGSLAGGASTRVAVPYGNVYDGVKTVCDGDDLGFRLYPQLKTGGYDLIFTTYAGLDRTSSQSTNPLVIFEKAMDSFTDVESIRSIEGYVTAAYSWPSGITAQSQIGSAFSSGASGFTGFNRRTLMVDATDVNVADYSAADLGVILDKRAKDAIVNNNYVRLLDGQLVPQNPFVYGVDYTLGDVIELRDPTSTVQKARITEYIRSWDSAGETAYPTLSIID